MLNLLALGDNDMKAGSHGRGRDVGDMPVSDEKGVRCGPVTGLAECLSASDTPTEGFRNSHLGQVHVICLRKTADGIAHPVDDQTCVDRQGCQSGSDGLDQRLGVDVERNPGNKQPWWVVVIKDVFPKGRELDVRVNAFEQGSDLLIPETSKTAANTGDIEGLFRMSASKFFEESDALADLCDLPGPDVLVLRGDRVAPAGVAFTNAQLRSMKRQGIEGRAAPMPPREVGAKDENVVWVVGINHSQIVANYIKVNNRPTPKEAHKGPLKSLKGWSDDA